jgi:hypothetical protein
MRHEEVSGSDGKDMLDAQRLLFFKQAQQAVDIGVLARMRTRVLGMFAKEL